MPQSIWKFPLSLETPQVLSMPRGAVVLTVQTQSEQPVLWALVDPDAPTEDRTFFIYGTGWEHETPVDRAAYRGTFQLRGGALVFHLFEVAS